MTRTTTPTIPRHPAPLEPADPPPGRYDGLIWVAVMLISSAVAVAFTVWVYRAIFH